MWPPPCPGVAAEVTWPPSRSQVEYLLKKLLGSLSLEMGLGELEELPAQDAQSAQTAPGLSVWQFLELFNSGRCLRGVGRDSLSMAIQEVYQELIQDVLKQVRQAGSPGGDPREPVGRWRPRRPLADFTSGRRAICGSEGTCGGTGPSAGSSFNPAASATSGVRSARRSEAPFPWTLTAVWR